MPCAHQIRGYSPEYVFCAVIFIDERKHIILSIGEYQTSYPELIVSLAPGRIKHISIELKGRLSVGIEGEENAGAGSKREPFAIQNLVIQRSFSAQIRCFLGLGSGAARQHILQQENDGIFHADSSFRLLASV